MESKGDFYMKKTNKIIPILLSMLFIFSLSACGKTNAFEDSQGNNFIGTFASCDSDGNVEYRNDGTTYDYSLTINEDGTFVFDYAVDKQFSGTWTKEADNITLLGNADSSYSQYDLYCHFDADGNLLVDAATNIDQWITDVLVRQGN